MTNLEWFMSQSESKQAAIALTIKYAMRNLNMTYIQAADFVIETLRSKE